MNTSSSRQMMDQISSRPTSTASSAPSYLSSRSANALISDLRPTTLLPSSLHHLNLLLDELLYLLVDRSESIDPEDVKMKGVPSVFGYASGGGGGGTISRGGKGTGGGGEGGGITGQALGREVISEAELELLAWKDRRMKSIKKRAISKGQGVESMMMSSGGMVVDGFGRDKKGLRAGGIGGGGFPTEKAVGMLRCKVIGYSTLASAPPDPLEDKLRADEWVSAGGSSADDVVAPSALYFTAILEHVCEHILTNVGRVIARDSTSSKATLQDLYIALCEDESVWALFKRMKVKSAIEAGLRASENGGSDLTSKPSVTRRQSRVPVPDLGSLGGAGNLPPSNSRSSGLHINASGGIEPSPKKLNNSLGRASMDQSRSGGPSSLQAGSMKSHQRNSSILSSKTREMLGAIYDGEESAATPRISTSNEGGGARISSQMERGLKDDDFDKLLNSGATMKVSLTPSRLKNYDQGKQSPEMSSGLFGHRKQASSTSNPTSPLISQQRSPNTATPNTFASSTFASSGSMSRKKLVPRDLNQIDSDEEGPLDTSAKGVAQLEKKERILDVLSTEPPWSQQAAPAWGQARQGGGGAPVIRMKSPGSPLMPVSPTTPSLGAPLGASTFKRSQGPPSPSALRSHHTSASDLDLNQPNEEQLGDRRQSKPKTQAQELAEFFSKTSPPGSANASPNMPSSKSAPSDLRNGRNDDDDLGERKPKTQTQALADFFATEPPPNQAAPPADLSSGSTNNTGRFKGFLSKITGNKSQADMHAGNSGSLNDEASLPRRESATSSAIRRQSSVANVANHPPSSYKGAPEPAPIQRSPSNQSLNRRPSATEALSQSKPQDQLVGSPQSTAPVELGPIMAPPVRPIRAPRKESTSQSPSPTLVSAGTMATQNHQLDGGALSTKIAIGAVAGTVVAGLAVLAAEETSKTASTEAQIVDERGAENLGIAEQAQSVPEIVTGEKNVHGGPVSEDVTIPETLKVDPITQTEEAEAAFQEESVSPSEGKFSPAPIQDVPQIPLSQVSSLRRLLQHATSADECRMLVNSLLLSWGVPHNNEAGHEPTPESMLASWLLTGQHAPPSSQPDHRRRQESEVAGEKLSVLRSDKAAEEEVAHSPETSEDSVAAPTMELQALE